MVRRVYYLMDTAPTESDTLALHDALPILQSHSNRCRAVGVGRRRVAERAVNRYRWLRRKKFGMITRDNEIQALSNSDGRTAADHRSRGFDCLRPRVYQHGLIATGHQSRCT